MTVLLNKVIIVIVTISLKIKKDNFNSRSSVESFVAIKKTNFKQNEIQESAIKPVTGKIFGLIYFALERTAQILYSTYMYLVCYLLQHLSTDFLKVQFSESWDFGNFWALKGVKKYRKIHFRFDMVSQCQFRHPKNRVPPVPGKTQP